MSTAHPEKVATPELAAFGLAVHVRVPVPLVIARVTALVSLVAVLPEASCTVTTGWVANATPPVLPLGIVVKASFLAVPRVIPKVLLTALVRPVVVAVRV